MNRQMKRMQAKSERQQRATVAERRQAAAATTTARAGAPGRTKVGARQFLREVRQELKKVDWPTRQELGTYTVVVLVTVVVLGAFVFVLDLGFTKVVFDFLSGN